MNRMTKWLPLGVWLSLTPVWPAALAQQQQQQAPPGQSGESAQGDQQNGSSLDPAAIATLKAMSERLAAAKSLSFTAVSTRENIPDDAPPYYETTLSKVTLQRPDQLRVLTPGDGPASEFYYDGKKMTLYVPEANTTASGDAPPTIDAMIDAAWTKAGIYFPFVDMIQTDPYHSIADGLEVAADLGTSSVVGGTTTDRLAILAGNVQAELWVGHDDHMPRMIRAIYPTDAATPRFQIEFSDWHLDPPIEPGSFASAKAAAAQQVEFTPPPTAPNSQ